MSPCNCPTITSPNGGETIFDRTIEVKWYSPTPRHPDGTAVWYELFFTSLYGEEKKNEWRQIASLPGTSSSFTWKSPFGVRSKKCRFAIRCRDASGDRSTLSTTADDFEIAAQTLSVPAVVSPLSNTSYRFSVPITLDHTALHGTASQRAYYQVYYNSEKKKIDWTPIKENILVGSDPFLWDITGLEPSNDYNLKFILQDEDGRTSAPVFIHNLTLSSINHVLLDTIAPTGTVTIQNRTEFTKDRDIVIKFDAFDETTDTESIVIDQKTEDGTSEATQDQQFAKIKTWHLVGEDGVKIVEGKFKDFAGNVARPATGIRAFRQFFSNDNEVVSAFAVDNSDVWSVFKSNGTNSFFKNRDFVQEIDGEATSMVIFDDIPYLTIDNSGKGTLQKFQDDKVTTVNDFTAVDSIINTMAVFEENLYLGLQNGEFYKFNGTNFTLVKTFDTQIKGMSANIVALFLFFENSDDIELYDGTDFITASFLNGNQ